MRRARFTSRGVGLSLCATAAVGALALTGCGSSDYKNELRPPRTKVVSAFISERGISISPAHLGAGPVTIIVTNQAGTPQSLTLETSGDGAGTTRETAKIFPTDTASMKATVDTGSYRLRASSDAISEAVLRVGAERPSSQNDLQLP